LLEAAAGVVEQVAQVIMQIHQMLQVAQVAAEQRVPQQIAVAPQGAQTQAAAVAARTPIIIIVIKGGTAALA
tara:strand:+ start:460 stop:675 length:216 start_codon:yes stop_codon:yes gene_type:complete